MPLNTIIPIVFAVMYLAYVVWAAIRANKTGNSYRYRPVWVLASIAILGFCIYALITGRAITDFLG